MYFTITIIIVAVAVWVAYQNYRRDILAFKAVRKLGTDTKLIHFNKKNLVFLFLIIIFALPIFLPIEKYFPDGNFIKGILAMIAGVLALIFRRKLLNAAEATGMEEFARRYRGPSRFFVVILIVCILILLGIYAMFRFVK